MDDEVLARTSLRILLAEDADVELVGECGTGREAVALVQELSPDLLLLDVQMPGMDGFEVLQRLAPERMPAVIFTTAYDAHALRAFEVHALDYLLKPFSDERFARALAHAKEHIQRGRVHELTRRLMGMLQGSAPPPAPPPAAPAPPSLEPVGGPLERIAFKDGGRVVFIGVDEVDWIEADDYYVQLHQGSRSHLLRESLRELELRLPQRRFARIHRSTIVNVSRVKELRPLAHGEAEVILHDGTTLRLSRSRREHLLSLLGMS
ncbi:response regulator transcription factor [Pyxidicoccus parkwayensis]|uniref:Response regulator transcription factor n=1 Tax=Pyxidicoccus parkwayensis TaxID=2813578 RepID=A0ABX7PCD1_9BACT|nr:response regulator transcription factor [Pyxidicoccus parkwaysis]